MRLERNLAQLREAREDARPHLMRQMLDGLADELVKHRLCEVTYLLGGT